MMDKEITLPWADEFRRLLHKHGHFNNEAIVVSQFLNYCNNQENEINKRWQAKLQKVNDEMQKNI